MLKPIAGYEDYLVNEKGQVFSKKSNKFLKPSMRMYSSVELSNKNGRKRVLVHRLVAEAFLPNPDNLPQVNHKDENKHNNDVRNLEWCTAKYNMNYGEAAKTRHSKVDYSKPVFKENAIKNGKKHSKPVLQFTRDGEFVNRYESGKEASRQTGANHSHILECCSGKRYKTVKGFVWRYERGDDLLVSQF